MTAQISHTRCCFLHVDHNEDDLQGSTIVQYLATVEAVTNCPVTQLSSEWIDATELKAAMDQLKYRSAETNRTVLLVSGSYLEDQVTICSLEALIEGFDVHLLCDLISARDLRLKPVLYLRLVQAGAVPSSLRQFLFTWMAADADQLFTSAFKKLLVDYESVFAKRPA